MSWTYAQAASALIRARAALDDPEAEITALRPAGVQRIAQEISAMPGVEPVSHQTIAKLVKGDIHRPSAETLRSLSRWAGLRDADMAYWFDEKTARKYLEQLAVLREMRSTRVAARGGPAKTISAARYRPAWKYMLGDDVNHT